MPRLEDILERSARSRNGLTFYGQGLEQPEYLSYRQLRDEALLKADQLRAGANAAPGAIVLIHFHTHRENVLWFWASILAGCVPAMSTPLVNDPAGRKSHLAHLHRLLLDPTVITNEGLKESDFKDSPLNVTTAEALDKGAVQVHQGSSNDSFASCGKNLDVNQHSFLHLAHSDSQYGLEDDQAIDPFGIRNLKRIPNLSACDVGATLESRPSSVGQTYNSSGGNSMSSYQASEAPDQESGGSDTEASFLQPADGSQTSSPTSLQGVAALMLTSGSTGSSKAVCLTHEQIIHCCKGKLTEIRLHDSSSLLNWIGLDHVAGLTEIHLAAMLAGCHQVHVATSQVISDPISYLRLLSKHQVSGTFAPNFLLHKLVQELDTSTHDFLRDIDLHDLKYLVSGGEPNQVEVCIQLSEHFRKLGATASNIITPAFGMTETCAGSIYNRRFSQLDAAAGNEFAALGYCVPGIEMRVTPFENGGSTGALEIRGPIVFSRYFNNAQATSDAFTDDGWFITGDTAEIDSAGVLRLIGRSKDLININGVKYLPHEVENALEIAEIAGVDKSYIVCFAHRSEGAATEQVHIIYQRAFDEADSASRIETLKAITRTVLLFTGSQPHVLPLARGLLERTTLGKISRAKVKTAFLSGQYDDQVDMDLGIIQSYQRESTAEPGTASEKKLMSILQDIGLAPFGMDIDTPVFEVGVTSVDLVRIKREAEEAFQIGEIPIITVMNNSTIRLLAAAIERLKGAEYDVPYDPVIPLQEQGDKTPLWLLHPGIGEVLVFLGLVQYFPDRPLFALRARGLNPGETEYKYLEEVVSSYHSAIRAKQPHGPYAIAGYSYGSMLAFEIAKRLEAGGSVVQFLGSFNLPPHIKTRMRQLDWTAGMLHIAHFCSIISEERSEELMEELRPLPHAEQARRLLAESDAERCAQLALNEQSLHRWTDVSWSLQRIGWEYEPSGEVSHFDVFYCQPLKVVAPTREVYRKQHLNRWIDFIRDDIKFWEVGGQHYTMIGPDHVSHFQQTLKRALTARGC